MDALLRFSRYPVPHALLVDIADTMDRYGRLQLLNDPAHGLVLRGLDRAVLTEVAKSTGGGKMVCSDNSKVCTLEPAASAFGETGQLRRQGKLETYLRELLGVLSLPTGASGAREGFAL